MSREKYRDIWKIAALDTDLRRKADATGRRLSVGRMTVGVKDSDDEIVDQVSAIESMPRYFGLNPIVTFMHGYGGGAGKCVDWSMLKRSGVDGTVPRFITVNDPQAADAVGVVTEYGKGYSFGTQWGIYEVDWIWSMIDQEILRTHSIGFQGYNGGETEEGTPIVKVRRIFEYAVTTVPAQEEAAFEVQRARALSLHLCQECNKRAEEALRETKKNLTGFGLELFLRGLSSAHAARSHRKKTVEGDQVAEAGKAFYELAKLLKGGD